MKSGQLLKLVNKFFCIYFSLFFFNFRTTIGKLLLGKARQLQLLNQE
jgi:hypothetical protein